MSTLHTTAWGFKLTKAQRNSSAAWIADGPQRAKERRFSSLEKLSFMYGMVL